MEVLLKSAASPRVNRVQGVDPDHILHVLFIMLPWVCECRMIYAPRQPRLSIAEAMPSYYYTNINGVPGTYSFGYDNYDPATGNTQYRMEERYPNGTVVGSYGYIDARGKPQRFRYIADEKGYRVTSDPVYSPAKIEPTAAPNEATESSITWTRPKRPNKNKADNSYFVKLPIQKARYYSSERNNELESSVNTVY